MTEAEWLASADFQAMLRHLRRRGRNAPSPRKWRLFACAACRTNPRLMADEVSGWWVELAERFADGRAREAELGADRRGTYYAARNSAVPDSDIRRYAELSATDIRFYAGNWAEFEAADEDRRLARATAEERTTVLLASLAHDIFGNPFRPSAVEPAWLTPPVVALAEGIYRNRAFDRLPILADVLEDAGCANADMLTHCRGNGPHVRGCWVVDLLTGRK